MYKCTGCGKEFITSQGLGSHQRFGCGATNSLAVRQATEVLRPQTSGLRSQVSGLKTASIPDLRSRPQTSDLRPQQAKSVQELRTDLADLEARQKLAKQQRYINYTGYRHLGIALVIIGALLWFAGGGKLKLPFFGDVD